MPVLGCQIPIASFESEGRNEPFEFFKEELIKSVYNRFFI